MKVLAFDIETLALEESYNDLSEKGRSLWIERCLLRYKDDVRRFDGPGDPFYQYCWEKYSGVTPAFSRILCISVAVYDGEKTHINTYSDPDEKVLITDFLKIIQKLVGIKRPPYTIAGHNIKNFDIPFVIKRAITNGIEYSTIPEHLQISDKKPWDLGYILDTKEIWKCGSQLFNETLDETCYTLGIASPKESLHGGEIYDHIYKKKGSIDEVVKYCENDANVVVEILKKII